MQFSKEGESMKLWSCLLIAGLVIWFTACEPAPEGYETVKGRVFRSAYQQQKANFAATGKYGNITFSEDNLRPLKDRWSIEVLLQLSEAQDKYIIVLRDTRNGNTTCLDQDSNMWNGNLKPEESAFTSTRKDQTKFPVE